MEHWRRIAAGFFVSMFVGYIFLWLIVEKILWRYIGFTKHGRSLTGLVGIIERFLYTGALMAGAPQWIGVWLALKVAVAWRSAQERKSPSDNVWLIGNAISVLFGLIGAWVALGKPPLSK